MGLSNANPKVGMQEFCRDFYDSQIFNPNIGGIDAGLVWCQNAYNSIAEADKSFKNINFTKFQEEMNALRMELFALAWRDKFKSEQYTIPQSFFTEHYLEKKERPQIWDIMGEYNLQLSHSATLTETGEQMQGRIGRALVAKNNSLKMNMFSKWVEANIKNKDNPSDEEQSRAKCVARVANRIGVDIKRSDCIAVKILAPKLAGRVGCNVRLNSEAQLRLCAIIFGLYQGAKAAINDVDIQM